MKVAVPRIVDVSWSAAKSTGIIEVEGSNVKPVAVLPCWITDRPVTSTRNESTLQSGTSPTSSSTLPVVFGAGLDPQLVIANAEEPTTKPKANKRFNISLLILIVFSRAP